MGKTISILVIVVIVILGGWYFYSAGHNLKQQEIPQTSSSNATTSPSETSTSSGDVTVTYTDAGFSPSTVTIQAGQSVTWVDQRSGPMWVASDPHPVHTGYDGTSRSQHCAAGYTGATPFDECGGGTSYTFTFDKVGTWGYHDHISDSASGTVIVTPVTQ